MMGKKIRNWLIAATLLVIVGLTVLAGVLMSYDWDVGKLTDEQYETRQFITNEEISHISINTDTADIRFMPSEDGKSKVICYDRENEKHSVSIRDGTLTIGLEEKTNWYEYISFGFGTPKITVYLPGGEYGKLFIKEGTGDVEIPQDFQFESIDISASTGHVTNRASASGILKIKTSTGDILVESVSADGLDLSVSTGNVTATDVTCRGTLGVEVSTGKAKLTDVACKTFVSQGSTGDLSLQNLVAAEQISIERSTGDVTFDGCDAAEIFVNVDTGGVTGSLRSGKVFVVETDTGDVDVPKTITGGRCEITTSTGDITITVWE